MNSHEVFIHIHQGCFAGTRAIVRLPQCQWSKPDGYGKISQCITTTKHSKAKTVCIFLGIYCMRMYLGNKMRELMSTTPTWKASTVRYRYNAVNFLPNPHEIHPIVRPLGRGMVCNLWFDTDLYSASANAVQDKILCYIWPRYNGTRLYLSRPYTSGPIC